MAAAAMLDFVSGECMSAGQLCPWMIPGDLAPGDQKSLRVDWKEFELHRITSVRSPEFDRAYSVLWEEFHASGELETREVLRRRLERLHEPDADGALLIYEMLLVTRDGDVVGVRDHTAIVSSGFAQAVVHMSHNFVMPAWRRSGIAGWLRALPVQTARAALTAAGCTLDLPVSLVAEMEPADPSDPARVIRLTAYEKAGYWKVDPRRVDYLQPDFRSPEAIDASGGAQPIRLSLLVRRVGRETERTLSGREVREIATALYRMYSREFRPADMAPLFAALDAYPPPDARIDLVPPTQPL